MGLSGSTAFSGFKGAMRSYRAFKSVFMGCRGAAGRS